MYQYSPSEKEFVKLALSYGLRVDGRTPDMRRTTETKCDVLDNLAGSSYISIDHGKC
jgi:exosome complex RNA-binding protein Rrp42 (RNase PH superfamily)